MFVGAGIALLGIILAGYEASILSYEASFTQSAEGTLIARTENAVVFQFKSSVASTGSNKIQQTSDAQYAFPRDERTAHLKIGDVVRAYYPPGKMNEMRLDRDFSRSVPLAAAALGAVLALVGSAIGYFSFRSATKTDTGFVWR